MGPFTAMRPVAAVVDISSGQHTAQSSSTHANAPPASRASSAATLEISRPVAQAQEQSALREALAAPAQISETARQKVEAAQRAYTMTLLAVGVNPFMNRPP